jgi:hypothetical protein
MKLYNDKLSDLRRQLQRECCNLRQLKVLKGTRWLLLKNSENLDNIPGKMANTLPFMNDIRSLVLP